MQRWSAALLLVTIALGLTLLEALRERHTLIGMLPVQPAAAAPAARDPAFVRALALFTGTQLDRGNRVELLLNGRGTFGALWRDLAAAQRTIEVQMYYAAPGTVSDSIARIVCHRAERGVRVRLLLDAFGAEAVERRWLDQLRRCGVQVALLRKLQWYAFHGSTNRSHVRVVVVDRAIGYTGGFGFADQWMTEGRGDAEWRETNVRVQGPVVDALSAAFDVAWSEVTLVPEPTTPEFAEPPTVASDSPDVRAGVLFTGASVGRTPAARFIALLIRSARARLYITNPYFVPDATLRQLLADASARGVDVRVLTAGAETDLPIPRFAAQSYYDELRAQRVRVYEYAPALVHAKTIVVDGYVSTVGSMNLDERSLALNDELNVVIVDSATGAQMETMFLDDLRSAREMTEEVLAARPWWQRGAARVAALLSRLL